MISSFFIRRCDTVIQVSSIHNTSDGFDFLVPPFLCLRRFSNVVPFGLPLPLLSRSSAPVQFTSSPDSYFPSLRSLFSGSSQKTTFFFLLQLPFRYSILSHHSLERL